MDPITRPKFERWLRQQVLIEDEDKGRCKKIVVRHVVSNKMGSELITVPVPKKEIDQAWFDETIATVENGISDDAEGLGGVQTYVILPYHANTATKPSSRFTIREATASVDDPEEMDSEPPTAKGMLAQSMRHTEAAIRMSMMSMGQIVTTLRHTNAKQAELIEKLVAEKMANLEMMEDLKSQKLEREILTRREESKEKMKVEIMDKVSTLVPVLVNRIAGKSLLPGKTTPMEGMIKGLVESIEPGQLESLQSVLKPTQLVALMEIFQSLQPEEKKDALAKSGE